MEKIKEILKSRKFWGLAAGLVIIWLSVFTEALTPAAAIDRTLAMFAAYIGGVGLENIGSNAAIMEALKKAILSNVQRVQKTYCALWSG